MQENNKKMTSDKKELFENTPEIKAILTLAVPTIISQLISVIYNIADTFYVGRTGNPYMIAGVSLSLPLFLLTVSFANLFGIGGGSLISRMMGRGEERNAKKICSFAVYGGLAVSALFSLITGFLMDPILYGLGASENTIEYARHYTLWVISIGGIPVILSAIEAHLLRNVGYSSQASLGLSGGGILNIVLDPLFMFVIFPEGKEVLAAAVATFISNLAAFIFLTFKLISVSKNAPLTASPSYLKELTKDDISKTMSVGVPSALLPGLLDVANIVMNTSMAAHGDLQLAAMGIVMKIERLPNAVNIGLSQGMLPLVAYNYSSGNSQRMKKIMNKARLMGLCVAVLFVVVYEIFATDLVKVFLASSNNISDAAATIAFATVFLKLRATASPFQFMNYHTSYCMQAMGDGKGTLIHSFVRILAIYIPLMYILNSLWGANGLAISLTCSEFLGGIFALILLRRWIRRNEK